MLKNKQVFLAILAMLFVAVAPSIYAQSDSPYSRYGLGNLRNHATGPSKGMGGVGYGLHTSQSANPMNPASYSQVDSLSFIFDIGVNYSRGTFNEGTNSSSKNNGGLDYVTILFPISKRIGVSLGVLPFSSTGYKMGVTEERENNGDKINYQVVNTGSGGLSQVYLGMGYQFPIKGLSAGFNASYLFGVLKRNNTATVLSQVADPTYEYSKMNVTGYKVDFGVQYKIDLPEYSSFTIGAVYSPKFNNKGKLERVQYQNKVNAQDIIYNERFYTGIPHTVGLGVAYNKSNNLLLGADVTFENWKNVKFSDEYAADNLKSKDRFNDRWKFALGAEYRVSPYAKSYFQRIKFRGGINYSNSYINVKTKEGSIKGYNEYGASLGFGLPVTDTYGLGRRTSYVNITFEYKYLKPEMKNMVKEKYFGVTFNMNVNELWFLQRKIN